MTGRRLVMHNMSVRTVCSRPIQAQRGSALPAMHQCFLYRRMLPAVRRGDRDTRYLVRQCAERDPSRSPATVPRLRGRTLPGRAGGPIRPSASAAEAPGNRSEEDAARAWSRAGTAGSAFAPHPPATSHSIPASARSPVVTAVRSRLVTGPISSASGPPG